MWQLQKEQSKLCGLGRYLNICRRRKKFPHPYWSKTLLQSSWPRTPDSMTEPSRSTQSTIWFDIMYYPRAIFFPSPFSKKCYPLFTFSASMVSDMRFKDLEANISRLVFFPSKTSLLCAIQTCQQIFFWRALHIFWGAGFFRRGPEKILSIYWRGPILELWVLFLCLVSLLH